MLRNPVRAFGNWPWLLAGTAFVLAFLLDACGGSGGSGTTGTNGTNGTNGGGMASLQGSVAPQSYAATDNKGSATLALTPKNGFSGSVSVTFKTNITEPAGVLKVPSTVTITAPNSPVQISGAAVNTPIDFSWTAWPAGKYEADAILTSRSTVVTVAIVITISSGSSGNPAAVVTWHNDNMRTGNYALETVLKPANVTTSTFGKLFAHKTDGPIEAEPLYIPKLAIAGKGTHNVVFVATLNGSVYAFDADNASGANANPLWTANLGPASPAGTGGGGDGFAQGIPGTPVIDPGSGTLYVVSKNGSGNSAAFRLHALDIGSGSEKFGGPVPVNPTVSGQKGGVGGTITLSAAEQYQRVALLLLNGTVYVGLGGLYGDIAPDRGWLVGYDAATLRQTNVFTTAPDAGVGSQTAAAGGSIWMSGAGISTDGTYLYAATGNGDFDANNAGERDYGDSVLKLMPSGNGFTVVDYFTPYNQLSLENADVDVGSGGPILIPGAATPYIVQTCKAGIAYVLNRNSLGKFDPAHDHVVQERAVANSEFLSSAAYFNGRVYFAAQGGQLHGYTIGAGGLAGPFGISAEAFDHATPTVSSNGTSNGIVWMVLNNTTASLCAYDALTLRELYRAGLRDVAGPFMKFGVPSVANGKVYVPCQDGLYVYGEGNFGPTRHGGYRAARGR